MAYFITGIVLIGLGVWQFYITRKNFLLTKHKGNQDTSPFIGPSLWVSFVMCIFLFIFGICAILQSF